MIKPLLQDEEFLADVQKAAREPARLHLWWLGQSGFLVQWNGSHLLLDPYLSDSLTTKYSATDKPHVRMTERVVAPDRLGFVDVVTSSHNHTDHLDRETLGPLIHSNPAIRLIVPAANREFAASRLQLPAGRLDLIETGTPLRLAGFEINAVPSAHETVETDDLGRPRHVGLVVRAGPWTVYHSGDTVRHDGMVESLRRWEIDIALLPINGRGRGVAGNLTGVEAAQLAKDIGARVVIPCHYDMFQFNTVSPDEFVCTATAIGQPHRLLRNGERFSSPAQVAGVPPEW
jgi:L-ascorbate metabolism protein UlaG (beta-lactamase superfamily)